MEAWNQALIDFGILWAGSSLVSLIAILALGGKRDCIVGVLTKSVTNGAIGAGAGVAVLEKFGVRFAMGVAAFVGAGLFSKEVIIALIAKKLGVHEQAKRD